MRTRMVINNITGGTFSIDQKSFEPMFEKYFLIPDENGFKVLEDIPEFNIKKGFFVSNIIEMVQDHSGFPLEVIMDADAGSNPPEGFIRKGDKFYMGEREVQEIREMLITAFMGK
jgi:hypothetical protein